MISQFSCQNSGILLVILDMNPLKIGWIGTGVMGLSMCKHLLNASYNLSVFNRTPEKAKPLLELGAHWLEPKQIASQSDVLFLMLGYPKDVEEMCLGQNGILNFMKKGSVLVDHTTSRPNLAVQIYNKAKQLGVDSVDAPVSGGDVGAREGKLVVMCGGEADVLERVRPIIDKYSRAVNLNGGPGQGQHTKMVNQIILAGNMAGSVEGLVYASRMGLDLHKTIDTIALGAASSTALTVLGRRMVDGNFDPGFYVQHYIKDLTIAVEECDRMGLALPCLSLVRQLYIGLKAQGGGRLGTQALIKVIENLNNYKIGK